jgi:hypothetical protein
MGLKIVMPAEYQRVREISLTAMPPGGVFLNPPLGGWGVKTQE